ncbi:MAG TPA: hypothetical protein VGO62_01575 [Myxococcota bacterium]
MPPIRALGDNRVKARDTAQVAALKPSLKSAPSTTSSSAARERPLPKAGAAPKHGEIAGGAARKSAVHARMGDVAIAPNKRQALNAKDNPEWFWHGHKKWKVAPPGVKVDNNADNKNGQGFIEKWQSPTTGKWVHNYTVDEMQRRAGLKFVHNRAFADELPALRKQVQRDLKSGGERATIALVVALIDKTYIRIGNDDSTQRSKIKVKKGEDKKVDTYGLTSMLGQHLSKDGSKLTFVGKAEVPHENTIDDAQLVGLLRALKKKTAPDQRIFQRPGDDAIENPASKLAHDVNEYLAPFGASAKSFRTYHATRLATAAFLSWSKQHKSATPADREMAVMEVAETVAEKLGHEPSVCLGNYIDPAIVALFVRGKIK